MHINTLLRWRCWLVSDIQLYTALLSLILLFEWGLFRYLLMLIYSVKIQCIKSCDKGSERGWKLEKFNPVFHTKLILYSWLFRYWEIFGFTFPENQLDRSATLFNKMLLNVILKEIKQCHPEYKILVTDFRKYQLTVFL